MARRIRTGHQGVVAINAPILALLTAGSIVPDGAVVDEALLEPDNTVSPEHDDTELPDGDAGETEEPATTDHEPDSDESAEPSVDEQPVKQAVKQTRGRAKA